MNNILEIYGPIIDAYSRKDAIEDGVLFDVTETAKEAGFKWPVAITVGVWALINNIPSSKYYQSVSGRLWDVLWMAFRTIKTRKPIQRKDGSQQLNYEIVMHHLEEKLVVKKDIVTHVILKETYENRMISNVSLKMIAGPGDNFEPVITISLPHED